MKINLKMFREFATICSYLGAVMAAVIGAVFALYKFKISREAEPNLQVETALSVHRFDEKDLLDVSIHIRNVGKAAAYISEANLQRAVPMARKVSFSENNSSLNWDSFGNQKLIEDLEFLKVDRPTVSTPKDATARTSRTETWRSLIVTRVLKWLKILIRFEYYVMSYVNLYFESMISFEGRFGDEYMMIYEPGASETYHVFISTDYEGPIWLRVRLLNEKEYGLKETTYKWRCDELFNVTS